MSKVQRIILAMVVGLSIALIVGYGISTHTGWSKFSMKDGENFQINGIDSVNISKIKFKECMFTATPPNQNSTTVNVSSVLNGMVYAYKDNTNKNYIFKLDDPGLSPYSFHITGYNDRNNRPDPNTKVTLIGYYKLLK